MKKHKFGCGCQFDVIAPATPDDPLPGLDIDLRRPQFCQAMVDLFASGRTKGVFQLEKNLGQTWSKRLKPESLEHVAALVALLRPGTLRAKDEQGVSMTQHYVNRKLGLEVVPPFHPLVDEALKTTFGIIVFQESSIRLSEEVAGFDKRQADALRAAIGKKLADEMAKAKRLFIDKATTLGIITVEQATELFDIIEKSNRYSFNKAHASAYGMLTMVTAWVKAHMPLTFFLSWVGNAHLKSDSDEEVYELVEDAKLFDVEIRPPDLRSRSVRATVFQRGVNFGLCDIKGVGESRLTNFLDSVVELEKAEGPLDKWTWETFLFKAASLTPATIVEGLASSGALAFFGKPRLRLLSEYRVWRGLRPGEQEWVRGAYKTGDNLSDLIKRGAALKSKGGMLSRSDRTEVVLGEANYLDHPPTSEADHPRVVAELEEKFLGAAISCTKLSGCDTSEATFTCRELADGAAPKLARIAVELKPPRPFETKTKRTMSYLTVCDETATLNDVVVFPDQWAEHSDILRGGNTVLLEVVPSRRGEGWVVETATQI